MSLNSSSFSLIFLHHCSDFAGGTLNMILFTGINLVLLLPLSLLIFRLGLQRWRQQRSFATSSHSDIFTYHWAALELIYVVGFSFYLCGKYFGLKELMMLGYHATSIFHPGQMSFHVLTCVEHYLAVNYPISYLQLKQSRGVRIRNISVGCVWLGACGWIGLEAWYFPNIPYVPIFCVSVLSIAVTSLCSLSVLHVLMHPGPRGTGGRREQSDQAKRRSFYTITAIMAVLWLFFVGFTVCVALDNSNVLTYGDGCLVLMSANWFMLPSSFVLPLLFLQRAGKLLCCQCSTV